MNVLDVLAAQTTGSDLGKIFEYGFLFSSQQKKLSLIWYLLLCTKKKKKDLLLYESSQYFCLFTYFRTIILIVTSWERAFFVERMTLHKRSYTNSHFLESSRASLCELSNDGRDFDGFCSDLHCPTFFKFASLPTESHRLLVLR